MQTYTRYNRPVPFDWKLIRLLRGNFNRDLGPFEVPMTRHEARNLRKHFFGPKGLRNVPPGAGVMEFQLPSGWMLELEYEEPDWRTTEPGYVVARFIPQEVAHAA